MVTGPAGEATATLWLRLETIEAAWEAIQRQPLIGVGLAPGGALTDTGYAVHNVLVGAWYQAGILGLLGISLVLTVGVVDAGRVLRRINRGDARRDLIVGVAGPPASALMLGLAAPRPLPGAILDPPDRNPDRSSSPDRAEDSRVARPILRARASSDPIGSKRHRIRGCDRYFPGGGLVVDLGCGDGRWIFAASPRNSNAGSGWTSTSRQGRPSRRPATWSMSNTISTTGSRYQTGVPTPFSPIK